ncbi:hypothetical protein AWH62_11020 [Maricaulis sp. W15]|nr:hypothetical protein AWH62_11020 [Maricaulis sp. W15]
MAQPAPLRLVALAVMIEIVAALRVFPAARIMAGERTRWPSRAVGAGEVRPVGTRIRATSGIANIRAASAGPGVRPSSGIARIGATPVGACIRATSRIAGIRAATAGPGIGPTTRVAHIGATSIRSGIGAASRIAARGWTRRRRAGVIAATPTASGTITATAAIAVAARALIAAIAATSGATAGFIAAIATDFVTAAAALGFGRFDGEQGRQQDE